MQPDGSAASEQEPEIVVVASVVDLSTVWYACKKCRTKVFRGSDIDPHSPGLGQSSFSWNKRVSTDPYGSLLVRSCVDLIDVIEI